MATDQMPVTPALITWARERAGFSAEEAAAKFRKIAAWEAGNGAPTYPQLEDLAEAFKVPVAVFFFPVPPKVPSITENFRTIPQAQLDMIAPRIRLLLRKAKAFQISLAELNGGRNPAPRLITQHIHVGSDISAGELADRVRAFLGVSIEQQISSPNVEIALEQWRSAFANVGVYIFKDAFKSPAYAGFCIYDSEFPIIYVNNSAAKERQIFTLFHELGHLLFHTSGIDFRSDELFSHLRGEARQIEVLCNRFAGVFLVPEDALLQEMQGREPTETAARELGRVFKVSWLVIYRRFLDLRLIKREMYAAAQSQADAAQLAERDEAGGGNYYNTTISYLGREFIGLAMREYYQNRITEEELAGHLGVALKNLNGIEDRFLKSQAAHA
jgi:Zn-dependent peptidase ImmA (M78 family)